MTFADAIPSPYIEDENALRSHAISTQTLETPPFTPENAGN